MSIEAPAASAFRGRPAVFCPRIAPRPVAVDLARFAGPVWKPLDRAMVDPERVRA